MHTQPHKCIVKEKYAETVSCNCNDTDLFGHQCCETLLKAYHCNTDVHENQRGKTLLKVNHRNTIYQLTQLNRMLCLFYNVTGSNFFSTNFHHATSQMNLQVGWSDSAAFFQ